MYNKSGRRYLREINLIFLKMNFIIAEIADGRWNQSWSLPTVTILLPLKRKCYLNISG